MTDMPVWLSTTLLVLLCVSAASLALSFLPSSPQGFKVVIRKITVGPFLAFADYLRQREEEKMDKWRTRNRIVDPLRNNKPAA